MYCLFSMLRSYLLRVAVAGQSFSELLNFDTHLMILQREQGFSNGSSWAVIVSSFLLAENLTVKPCCCMHAFSFKWRLSYAISTIVLNKSERIKYFLYGLIQMKIFSWMFRVSTSIIFIWPELFWVELALARFTARKLD